MPTTRSDIAAGALAGALGTAVMTVLMKPGLAGHLPPRWRPAEFVPRRIVQRLERAAEQDGAAAPEHGLSERQEDLAAALAHLGYGATAGALYGLGRGRWSPVPAPVAGAFWGAGVWALGYAGWLPALGVRTGTVKQPPRKWLVPIANHLLYGVTTALAFERLRRPSA